MSVNYSNGLAALSLLSNSNSFADYAEPVAIDSRAVRIARAQFTAAPSTPPWKGAVTKAPVSQQVTAIKRMTTIIDKSITVASPADRDIQTSFTTFKALDRLRLLAETSAAKTTSSAERLLLDAAFTRGLTDLQDFLVGAPTDKVALAFATATRRSDSVGVTTPSTIRTVGKGVSESRLTGIQGLTGNEVFRIDLARPGKSDTVTVDLSQGAQPPTLTSVAEAINTAITAIAQLDINGAVVLDANGIVVPKWAARVTTEKSGTQWGLVLTASSGTERVTINDAGARDAVFVATGLTSLDGVAATRLYRFDDAAGGLEPKLLGTISAVDRDASAAAALVAPKPVNGITLASSHVAAETAAQAVASDAAGNTYVVGTTSGDIGSNRSNGDSDLFLTKVDSRGGVVWQRSLGAAGSSRGAAISLAANGDIVVAGTVTGGFDGAATDGDLLVARFDANGDEKFATVVRSTGTDSANAVAVAADGTIYVGGRAASGGGDAFLARIDASGRLAERRLINSGADDGIKALAIGGDGNLLAIVNAGPDASLRRFGAGALASDLGSLSLGAIDARALAVAADGRIAIGGARTTAGDRDGVVLRIDGGLAAAVTTAIATAGSDQVDSIAWSGGDIIVGGRTTGDLDGARRGSTDGFVARLAGGSGTITALRQFGTPLSTVAPVRVAIDVGGSNAIGALGLVRGLQNPAGSGRLVAQTALRAGDEFSLKIGSGPTRKIVIAADDTVKTLVDRIGRLLGSKTLVQAGRVGTADVLRFQASQTQPIVLTAGGDGRDALGKLGIEPQRLTAPATSRPSDPKVRPGGTFNLDLSHALDLGTAKAAAVAVKAIKSAITTTQGAYRSLYWDAGKANLVNGFAGGTGGLSAAQSNQLAGYREALARLTPAADTNSFGYTGF